jgi:MarR family transcriptional regulator, organic hydroperoxide resistance regulator
MSRRKAPPPLSERISFLIHRVEAKTELVCNPLYRHLDVALQDTRVLVNLLEAGRLRVGDLVSLMAMPQSTISHQLRALEKRNLVRRMPGVTDSRSVLVELTSRGKDVARQCNEISEEVYRIMVEDLSASELAQLRAQLRSVFERLEKFGEDKRAERKARAKIEADD